MSNRYPQKSVANLHLCNIQQNVLMEEYERMEFPMRQEIFHHVMMRWGLGKGHFVGREFIAASNDKQILNMQYNQQ